MTCLGSFILTVLVFFAGMALGTRKTSPVLDRFLVSLQRRAALERIFQTHYWSQDYRTQDASEDYRSGTLRRNQPD